MAEGGCKAIRDQFNIITLSRKFQLSIIGNVPHVNFSEYHAVFAFLTNTQQYRCTETYTLLQVPTSKLPSETQNIASHMKLSAFPSVSIQMKARAEWLLPGKEKWHIRRGWKILQIATNHC